MARLKQSAINNVPHLNEYLQRETTKKQQSGAKLKQSAVDAVPHLNEYLQSDKPKRPTIEDVTKLSSTKDVDDVIAPVREDRTWFQKSKGNIFETILGTGGDIGLNLLTGIVDMGEKAVDALAWLAPAANQAVQAQHNPYYSFDIEQYRQDQEQAGEFIKKDLYDAEKVSKNIAKAILRGADDAQFYMNGGAYNLEAQKLRASVAEERDKGIDYYVENVDDYSVLGEKSDALVQSAGQLAAQVGLQAVGVPWFVTSGVTSFGGEAENALNEGATFEQAGASAAISAGAEIITEKLFGGDLFVKNAGSDIATKYLATAISNKTLRNLAKFGIDVTGEGVEEVFSQVMSNLGSSLYKEENLGEILFNEEALDEYLESFIGGGVLGGGMSAVNAVQSKKSGKDYTTGLTANETKVIDAIYKDMVAEAEKNGKLSAKEKANLYDDLLTKMDRGEISTEKIEELFGGDTYKTYQDIIAEEDATLKEFSELYKGEELKKKVDEFLANSKRFDLQKQLSEEVSKTVSGDRLFESYMERGRRSQHFEADITQYDEKQRAVIQSAIDSGVLNNTRRSHEMVDLIAKIAADKGVTFDFTNNERIANSEYAVKDATVNGYVTADGHITLNVESPKYLNSTVGHELTHVLEGTELYSELQNTLFEYAKGRKSTNNRFQSEYHERLHNALNLYEGKDGYLGQEGYKKIQNEVAADLVGDYLFTDDAFIRKLSTENRNVFEKIYDEIKYLCKVVTAGSKEARELERVKKAFEDAYRGDGKAADNSGVQYSIYWKPNFTSKEWAIVNRKKFAEFDDPKHSLDTDKNWMYFNEKGSTGFAIYSKHNADDPTILYGSHGKQAERDYAKVSQFSGGGSNHANRGRTALDRLLTDIERNQGNRSDGISDAPRGKTAVGDVPLPFGESGSNGQRDYADGTENSRGEVLTEYHSEEASDDLGASSLIGAKYSLSDTNGKHLTKEQQTYFKDSKVRDENGALKVMYHGTPNGDFTVFKDGTYFTDNKEYADRYHSTSASSISSGKTASNPKTFEVYLDIKKPFDINDAEARDIYINEYIKGGNAMGINPYLSDAEYDKITTIDWTEGEDLRDFLIDNGYDYDGLVLDEGADGGYGDEVKYRGKSYVIFSPEQAKNIDNTKPTSNPDIRYSLSDADYMDAVNRGDMVAAQQMVNAAARAAGYSDDFSWKMQHTAPNSKDDVSLVALKESGLVPSDYWEHPEWYTYGAEERESFWKVRDAIARQEKYTAAGKDRDARIYVYRAVDKTKNAREDFFRNGDWVTPSYEYAVNEGQMNPNGYRIIKASVPIKDLYWDGNSIAELGYDDGENYAYADTKNNRKLLDPVTYDDFGIVIPLSKRFKKRIDDPRYSLSVKDEAPTTFGNYHVSGKDVMYTPEDVAPVRSDAANSVPVNELFPDDGVSVDVERENITKRMQEIMARAKKNPPEAEVKQLVQEYTELGKRLSEIDADEKDRIASLEDAPPEVEAPYYEETGEQPEPDNPFEDRDWYEVGKRNVKAYMYENPEVKPFFQAEAEIILGELRDTVKGERHFNSDLHYETGGEYGWTGTKRMTSDSIAQMKDDWGYTYAEIEKGLNAIIEDNGAENIAAAKKIEFIINDRLLNGYKAFGFDMEVPPNEDYIKLLNEKQITEYSKEAFDALVARGDEYAPPVEDIAPLAEATPDTDVAPIYEAKDKKAPVGQTTMFEPPKPNPKVATVLSEEVAAKKKKSGVGMAVVSQVVDKGMVFENLSLTTGNMELQAKYNSALPTNTEAKAQYFMEHGANGVTSLKDIMKAAEKTGKSSEFCDYLYHVHNIDRMTLDKRFGVENKTVFGETVTADVSRKKVAQYEKANPAFKAMAEKVYAYNKHLRKLLVDGGVISQDTADLWEKMYPHYVPVRRVDSEGLNVSVPLDTKKTGVNAPIKRATGGSSDILPLFNTMAQRTEQTYRAIARNAFGVELKNTLGTTIDTELDAAGVDEVIDTIVSQDEQLLKPGTLKSNPTFTVFENGERVEFEITEDMYDALKPAGKVLGYRNKAVNKVSNWRRNLLTTWNPVFALYRNPVKDLQEVAINSQHPLRTYWNIPKAMWEIASGGEYATEYHQNGGKSNTYFDSRNNKFKTEDGIFKKTIGMPIRAVETAGEFIEEIPRLAEYIASRKDGRSVDRSMLDAARVTTNFAAGGDFTKFFNSHGFNFLNASVQGASQHVRNFREAKQQGLKGYVKVLAKYTIAGLAPMVLNGMLWDDDEEYEELSDYVKQNYWVVAKTKDGKFVRIPKGRTAAVMQNAFEQMQNLVTGDDEVDFGTFFELFMNNIAPSNPVENNILAPVIQTLNNEAWYGGDLVPARLQDLPAAEQFDESTDSISKWLGEATNTSPYKWNYLIDQYSGGAGDVFLPMLTPEAESGDNSLVGNFLAPWKKELTTDSVLNNKNPGDFYDLKEELEIKTNSKDATEEDAMRSMYMDSVSWDMSDLYKQKREVQSSDLPDSEKYEEVRRIQEEINELANGAMDGYQNVKIDGLYSEVGDRRFNKDADSGKWYEIQAKNSDGSANYFYEQEQKVTKRLGISSAQYWNNREEYDYAYNKPEKYALSQAVGGYKAYKGYTSELWDIKADKDENGKSINGSRKDKVIDYINALDADYGEKIILFKSEYNADDTYNDDIIDYLNSRDDISYQQMETILKELGFEVDSKGNISW